MGRLRMAAHARVVHLYVAFVECTEDFTNTTKGIDCPGKQAMDG